MTLDTFLETHKDKIPWKMYKKEITDELGYHFDTIQIETTHKTPDNKPINIGIVLDSINKEFVAYSTALNESLANIIENDDTYRHLGLNPQYDMDYLNEVKDNFLELAEYENINEHFNTVFYRFKLTNFTPDNLNKICNYIISVITTILNYKKYNWGI